MPPSPCNNCWHLLQWACDETDSEYDCDLSYTDDAFIIWADEACPNFTPLSKSGYSLTPEVKAVAEVKTHPMLDLILAIPYWILAAVGLFCMALALWPFLLLRRRHD